MPRPSHLAPIFLFASLVGCAAPSPDASPRAATPLTILEANGAEGRLTAVFTDAGRTVRFEVRRGESMSELYRDARATINHEMDGRVLDQEGEPLFLQFGGDRLVDPTWKPGAVRYLDVATRRRDMARALAAASAFEQWSVSDPALAELRATAIELALVQQQALDNEPATPGTGAASGAPSVPVDESPALGAKSFTTAFPNRRISSWSFAVWRKDITGPIGDHSAVMLRGHYNGEIVYSSASCNHGACAGWSSMNRKCVSVTYADDGTDNRPFYSETSDEKGVVSGGCLSAYDPIHIGSDKGHNCHNDTRLQRYAIRFNDYVSSCVRKGDCGELCNEMHYNAPDCY